MTYFSYQQSALCAEQTPLSAIAQALGTPCFVYSQAALTAAYQAYADAFAGRNTLVCFAMKANSNLSILQLFAKLGAGFDIVSGGELARALAAGADPKKIVFSGVGKSRQEISAALQAGILCFNVESLSELSRINEVASGMGVVAPISLRVNPNVDAKTHPYISTGLKENKFGIAYEDALAAYQYAASQPSLQVVGIDCHIGSQLTDVQPFVDALDKVLDLVEALAQLGITLHHLDLGGGVGICYSDEAPPAIADYAQALLSKLDSRMPGHAYTLLFEPGRSLVGNAGVLLTSVEYLKQNGDKHFAIVDAAMNDLMRPALYDAWHTVLPVQANSAAPVRAYDVVGPVCETGDFLAKNRELAVQEGDVLALMSAGAYGMAMASNYNTRPRAAEVLVDGKDYRIIKARESVDAMLAEERACLSA